MARAGGAVPRALVPLEAAHAAVVAARARAHGGLGAGPQRRHDGVAREGRDLRRHGHPPRHVALEAQHVARARPDVLARRLVRDAVREEDPQRRVRQCLDLGLPERRLLLAQRRVVRLRGRPVVHEGRALEQHARVV